MSAPCALSRMVPAETVAIALWAAGVLAILAGILVTIARLAVYRHTGSFDPPWRRGVLPILAGAGLVSAAAYLLGVRAGIARAWLAIGAVAVVIALITHRHRRR